jgi:hypothetical protein
VKDATRHRTSVVARVFYRVKRSAVSDQLSAISCERCRWDMPWEM